MIKWLKMNNETKNHNPINLKKKNIQASKNNGQFHCSTT